MTPTERFYRLLLHLYPRAHRAEYGDLMLTHFRDQLRAARQAGRSVGRLFLRTLLDAARTIPAEHLALAKESLMEARRPVRPLPWWQVALVILPGLALLPTLPSGDGTGYVFAAIILVMLIAGYIWQREGRFPAWALLLLGIISFTGAAMISAAVGSLVPGQPTLGAVLLGALIAVLLAAALVISVRHIRTHPLPPAIRWLLPLLLGCALAGGALRSVHGLLLQQEPLTTQAIPTLLMSGTWEVGMIIVLLAPVALGLPLARRYGLTALLFVVGCLYPVYKGIIDPGYAIGLWTDSALLTWMVELAAPALMLVVGPLWMLRAGSTRGRIIGALIPLALTFAVGATIPQVVRDYTTWLSLVSSGLQAVALLLIVIVAALLYRDLEGAAAPALLPESPTR
jgi:hypothetical protein